MIPGIKDALIFVMLEDGTVHQLDLNKYGCLKALDFLGGRCKLKLCEQAEPLTWERSEEEQSGAGSKEQRVRVPRPELSEVLKAKLKKDGEKFTSTTQYLDVKTGLLKLYGDESEIK